MLERLEGAVLVAAFAKDARLLPEQLLDLGGIVGYVEASGDEPEELLVVLPFAHATEQLVEGNGAPGVTRKAFFEGVIGGPLIPDLEREQRGLLPELRGAPIIAAAGAQLGRGPDAERDVSGALGAGPQALPRREIARPRRDDLLEGGPRRIEARRREE